jgi:hypothetical protein
MESADFKETDTLIRHDLQFARIFASLFPLERTRDFIQP